MRPPFPTYYERPPKGTAKYLTDGTRTYRYVTCDDMMVDIYEDVETGESFCILEDNVKAIRRSDLKPVLK